MRILMIAPEQNPVPGSGSVEICMLHIAKEWAKGHRVTLISRRKPGLASESRQGRVRILRVPADHADVYLSSVLNAIRGKTYDVIQVDNRPRYAAAVKALFPQTPVVLFLHSLTFVPATEAVARSLRRADRIIANSRSLQEELAARFPAQADKIRTVHLGTDVTRFKPKPKASAGGGSFRVLFAGRVIPRKGVPVLIRAVGRLRRSVPRAVLTVAGRCSPGYQAKLSRLAKREGVPVRFTGRVPHSRIHREYAKADVFVCPSQKHEAFGLVNVEAMASGLPVVASANGGIREIVRHGRNGYLVGAYDRPEAFARYLKKLAQDPSHARALGLQGRRDVLERFSWRRTAAVLASQYEALKAGR